MIYEKNQSADNSQDDDDEIVEPLQDPEQFFKDKNFRFSRRWAELKGNNFFKILNDLTEENGKDEKEQKPSKYEMANASVSSISTVQSQNDLWEAIDRRRSTPNLLFGRNNSEKALSTHSGATKKTPELTGATLLRIRADAEDYTAATSHHDNDKLKTKIERLQIQIDKMKEIHELEITSMQTAYQSKFKELIQGRVDDLKGRFESEIRSTLGEVSDLKAKLIEKESLITKINALVLQQENQLAQLKVKADKELFDSHMFQKKGRIMESSALIEELEKQNSTLQQEIESMRSMCKIYKDNAEKALQERNQAVKETIETKKRYEKMIQEMETKYKTEIMILTTKNSECLENIQSLSNEIKALKAQMEENQIKHNKLKNSLFAQLEESQQKFSQYKEIVEVELKVLRHIDDRDYKSHHREHSPHHREQALPKSDRFQTPESLSSENRRKIADYNKGAGTQGTLKMGKRDQTPQSNDGSAYTASKHMALNTLTSGKRSAKGSRGHAARFEETARRGRVYSHENSRNHSEGSSSSHSQSRRIASRSRDVSSPQPREKSLELPSLIINKKVTPEQHDIRKMPSKFRSQGGSPTNLPAEVPSEHLAQMNYHRSLEQASYTPLKSILETNRERDPQLLQSIDRKNFKEANLSQAGYAKSGQKQRALAEDLRPRTIEYPRRQVRKHERTQASTIQAKSLINASLGETGIGFRQRTKQLSIGDSLNQTTYTWGATKSHRIKATKDTFGVNLSITSKNTKNTNALNESSYI